MRNNQSLKKRYFAKLSANLIGLAIGLVTASLIPRGLGPKAYGDFNFLTNFFSQLLPLLAFGTSIGFFTKLSQRPNELGLISFYGSFTGIVFLLMFLIIVGSQFIGISDTLWIGQQIRYVYLASLFAALTWMVQLMTNVVDAFGLTVSSEIAKIIQKFIGLLIITPLYIWGELNLSHYFVYNYIVSILLIFSFIWIIKNNGISFYPNWKLSKVQIISYVKEFYSYSHPLFSYAILGVISGIFSRWLLQKYAGSIQQGFFGLSYQIGAICFLFTSAMTSLITREFSIAFRKNDIDEMARLFKRFIPMLYSLAAFFGCFASAQAEKITRILGGEQFVDAKIPMMIMAFYPIHQTYGQLGGSVFYATGQTRLYRNIGLSLMLVGLPLTYLVLAPINLLGFNAGATGLAFAFVFIQFIEVNVQLFFNSRFLNLNFFYYFKHQIICVLLLIGLAFISKISIDKLVFMGDNIIIRFLIEGIIYSMMVILAVILTPSIFGLGKKEIHSTLTLVLRKIKIR